MQLIVPIKFLIYTHGWHFLSGPYDFLKTVHIKMERMQWNERSIIHLETFVEAPEYVNILMTSKKAKTYFFKD